ncbi:hypothetical protein RP726_05580 [Candidatus Methylospira mobilis]|uniref:hypothetical protein n=1 Tax=Candidatus Methylospira mobilis TaxID=1808979 RepID=UPI0028EACA8A|nr:hypothetical protein [Candidatus Methylospira mobilis]WNV05882.1 hypothetical protein RP726_05580 [Candidatus Methylospira mobilis]
MNIINTEECKKGRELGEDEKTELMASALRPELKLLCNLKAEQETTLKGFASKLVDEFATAAAKESCIVREIRADTEKYAKDLADLKEKYARDVADLKVKYAIDIVDIKKATGFWKSVGASVFASFVTILLAWVLFQAIGLAKPWSVFTDATANSTPKPDAAPKEKGPLPASASPVNPSP